MKKKIAIFANGWSNDYLKLVLEGIQKRAAGNQVDLYTFLNYSSGSEDKPDNLGEKSIFELPDITMFDGVMLLTNTIYLASERNYLRQEVLKHHIPAITLEYELDGIPCICTDTYSGVYELTLHIIQEHNARHIVYVSGPEDNQESQNRMRAVNDALSTIGGQLTPEDIICGEWSYYATTTALSDWLNTHVDLPDAFVCANDEMALSIYATMDSMGKKIPEDVIVTGCDCIDHSQKIYPILSTVARDWEKLGYNGLDLLLQQINGESLSGTREYNSIPVLGESCGCKVSSERLQNRRRSIINNYKSQRQNNINEWHLRHIDDILTKMTSVRQLQEQLSRTFVYNHSFEGANFLVCLVDGFINGAVHYTYTPQIEVCMHMENSHAKPVRMISRTELLPPLEVNEEDSNAFLFLPLHVEEELIGYAVFINKMDIVYQQNLYTWSRHVSQDLERVRQNIRLEELNKKLIEVSMTDALTGLKNRTGYDALAFPYLQKCQQEGKLGCMIFADINRMKLINDKYGHLQGDNALCSVAEAIKRTMPKDWIAVRFGGDEFIMVGECKTSEEAEQLKKQLAEHLEQVKTERNLCFPLTASFGAVVMHPDENYSLEEYLRKADEAMYVMKQQAHARD
ncbi:MAG: GGDEF domain-containing protein [Lachnospiraceae bacterium]|nr:GGDEF domain-containing protein [Lachnospiraceae bacterium]